MLFFTICLLHFAKVPFMALLSHLWPPWPYKCNVQMFFLHKSLTWDFSENILKGKSISRRVFLGIWGHMQTPKWAIGHKCHKWQGCKRAHFLRNHVTFHMRPCGAVSDSFEWLCAKIYEPPKKFLALWWHFQVGKNGTLKVIEVPPGVPIFTLASTLSP